MNGIKTKPEEKMMKKLFVAALVAVLASMALPAAAQQAKPMRLTLNFRSEEHTSELQSPC